MSFSSPPPNLRNLQYLEFRNNISMTARGRGMLAKFGNGIYWLGCGVAVITIVRGFKLWLDAGNEALGFSILFWITAAVVWLIGRAFQYVLRKL